MHPRKIQTFKTCLEDEKWRLFSFDFANYICSLKMSETTVCFQPNLYFYIVCLVFFSYNTRKDRMQINCLFLHFITTDILSMTIWWPFFIMLYIFCRPFIKQWYSTMATWYIHVFQRKKEILHNPCDKIFTNIGINKTMSSVKQELHAS